MAIVLGTGSYEGKVWQPFSCNIGSESPIRILKLDDVASLQQTRAHVAFICHSGAIDVRCRSSALAHSRIVNSRYVAGHIISRDSASPDRGCLSDVAAVYPIRRF